MDPAFSLRARARRRHDELRAALPDDSDGPIHAAQLLEIADGLTGLFRETVAADNPLLDGGLAVLDRQNGVIWTGGDTPARLAVCHQAHEYAHFWLHSGSFICSPAQLDPTADPTAEASARVADYSPRERLEREANLFARELLLPSDRLRRWALTDGMDAATVAARVGVPLAVVQQQLVHALLVGDLLDDLPPPEAEPTLTLDPSQQRAAQAVSGPVFIEAGPGTGKTRAFVGRLRHLLGTGVEPERILSLTFSRRAAEEIRDRVGRFAPDAAPRLWMGTFHAFGLELLRKCAGLPTEVAVIDPTDAVLLVESILPDLPLVHYQRLSDPAGPLPDILSAISRAKDELVDADDYRRLADAMLAAATSADDQVKAEKALEVAAVYERYTSLLDRLGLLDYGDLVARSVRLLEADPAVRDHVRRLWPHLLVDEVQDVNLAGLRLLQAVAGDGAGLWAVGDLRQAIYRFRGASPHLLRDLDGLFPGATVLPLERNYRAQPALVEMVSRCAERVTPGLDRSGLTGWTAVRPDDGGRVAFTEALDDDGEGASVTSAIQRLQATGTAYRDQAVLARSHSQLADLSVRLEAAGIPTLYLGDLFTRPEVADLLARLDLATDPHGRALVRFADRAGSFTLDDVSQIRRAANAADQPFPAAFGLVETLTLTDDARAALRRIGAEATAGSAADSSSDALIRLVVSPDSAVRPLLDDRSVAARSARLAIHQLLTLAHGFDNRPPLGPAADEPDRRRAFLKHIRALTALGADHALSQTPTWAAGLDAVRLHTVHGAKGLEWSAVHLPRLNVGSFPASRQGDTCPPPLGMLPDEVADGKAVHEVEEACLFFVALSRARDTLFLSRTLTGPWGETVRNRTASPWLAPLGLAPTDPPVKPKKSKSLPTEPALAQMGGPTVDVERLKAYRRCPKRVQFDDLLRLPNSGDTYSAYGLFHRAVYSTLRELQAATKPDATPPLDRFWAERGPVGQPYEALYRTEADQMIARAVARMAGEPTLTRPHWLVPLDHGAVRLQPDHVTERTVDGVRRRIVQRWRTRRPSKSELDDSLYGLYVAAAEPTDLIEVVFLSTDETAVVELTERKVATRLGHFDDALAGLAAGHFPPAPSADCPRCPHFFACPRA